MDPNNNNQPINTNPLGAQQPAPQPIEQPVVQPAVSQSVEAPVAAPITAPASPAEPVQQASSFFTPTPPASAPISAPAPTAPPAAPLTPTITTPAFDKQPPKSGSKKGIALLTVLLILILGMAGYVFFAKNQLNIAQKKSTENTSVVIPTATIAPTVTPATVEQVIVDSPEADLNAIEQDVLGL